MSCIKTSRNNTLGDTMIKIESPLKTESIKKLHAGDKVLLSGVLYTARDAAHKKLIDVIEQEGKLPFDIENQIIYYVGPTPTKVGEVIGSAGPTTSLRMDAFTPQLLEKGLKGMIGKGKRSDEVIDVMKASGAVYFAAVGGAAALISKAIISSEIIAYEDLGTEAIRKLMVKDLPLVVAVDSYGSDVYKLGRESYLRSTQWI
jgi:fumarate hydratase subunit beta